MIVVVATTVDGVDEVRERVAALGAGAGAGAGAVEVAAPGGGRRLVLATVEDPWEAERVVRGLRAEGRIAVARPEGGAPLEAWREHTRPVEIGDHLEVRFAWSEHERRDQRRTVELGLGGFGSGAHPTTRMLLEELAARTRGGERVLDVGCGSGVLGLAALSLGAAEVVAVDLKPEAVEATRRNAALNGMADRVHATSAPLDALDHGRPTVARFDVVLANIGRAGVVAVADEVRRLLAPHGWLAVSGFAPAQCDLVGGFLQPLREVERRVDGEWATSTFARDPDADPDVDPAPAVAGCQHPRPGGH